MKNIRNTIFIACFLSLANVAWAGGGLGFEVRVSDSNSFVLKLKNPEKSRVEVSITDMEGTILHEETHAEAGFKNKYNLKNLPAGKYNLVLNYEDRITIQPITKQRDLILIDKGQMQTIMPPQITQTADYLEVKMNCPAGMHLFLKIQDDLGNQLYLDSFKSEGMHRRRFDLKRLEQGEYHVSVTVGGPGLNHQFSERFDLMAGK